MSPLAAINRGPRPPTEAQRSTTSATTSTACRRWSQHGTFVYYPLVVAAVAGAVVLIRRRTPLWPLAATFVMVTITAMVLYGLTRFRVPAEVAIVVLAAVLVDHLLPGGETVPRDASPEADGVDRDAGFAPAMPQEAG